MWMLLNLKNFIKRRRFNCKYSGILRMTWIAKCLLLKPIYKWQPVAILPQGETRRQTMAPTSAVLFAGSLLKMHKWQVSTPDNYRLFLCLPLPLLSSCSPQPALLSPSAGLLRSESIPQKRTGISTAAQNMGSRWKSWWAVAQVSLLSGRGKLLRTCWPSLYQREEKYKNSRKFKIAEGLSNVTAILWVFLKAKMPRAKLEVAIVTTVTTVTTLLIG